MSCQGKNCRLCTFERNRYFYGKLMTVEDFSVEQEYFNRKRYLLNRLVHGSGIVSGLEAGLANNGGIEVLVGEGKRIYLSPGVALDCYGREIVLAQDQPPVTAVGNLVNGDNFVYLQYHERFTEKVPAAANPSGCGAACCDNRIAERFEIVVSNLAPPPATDCPKCEPKVLLTVLDYKNNRDLSIDQEKTAHWRRMVYVNPLLYELVRNHILNRTNPHRVTAQQVDTQGGANKLVQQINAGSGIINGQRLDSTIARASQLAEHTGDRNNPHQVTAQQVDNQGGTNMLVQQINAGSGIVNGQRIDSVIARVAQLTAHTDNKHNPHTVQHTQTAPQGWDGSTNSGRDRHLSAADAAKWNGAVFSVNGVKPADNGNLAINAGDGLRIEPQVGTNAITISATGGSGSLYLEYPQDKMFVELLKSKSVAIEHKFGRYPVVDLYEYIEEGGYSLITHTDLTELAVSTGRTYETLSMDLNAMPVAAFTEELGLPISTGVKLKTMVGDVNKKLDKNNLVLSDKVSALLEKIGSTVLEDLTVIRKVIYLRKLVDGSGLGRPRVEVRQTSRNVVQVFNLGEDKVQIKIILTA